VTETPMCPICSSKCEINGMSGRDASWVSCNLCGIYGCTRQLLMELKSANDRSLFPYLSAHTRQASDRGDRVLLMTDNWEGFAKAHINTSVSQKVYKLLKLIADRSYHPGSRVEIASNDRALIDVASDEELIFLLDHLREAGYLLPIFTGAPLNLHNEYSLSIKGWNRIEDLVGGGIPGRCFVAMSFDPALAYIYDEGIYPALKVDCGFDPVRVDRVEHNDDICDKIIAEIRMAELVVADFSQQKAGVYFEAGYALGLGRPVIWMCKEDELKNSHFDTRQYNHIPWTSPVDLREKLKNRILATILIKQKNKSLLS
jgi:hypothetical protein